jgi:hypothetical protein
MTSKRLAEVLKKTTSRHSLYETFWKEQLRNFFAEALCNREENDAATSIEAVIEDGARDFFKLYAANFFFPKSFEDPSWEYHQEILKEKMKSLDLYSNIGLTETDSLSQKIVFIHSSLAEYFLALFLFDEIGLYLMKTAEFRKVLFSEVLAKKRSVTTFFNSMLAAHVDRSDWKDEEKAKFINEANRQFIFENNDILASCVKLAIDERCAEVISLLIELLIDDKKQGEEREKQDAIVKKSRQDWIKHALNVTDRDNEIATILIKTSQVDYADVLEMPITDRQGLPSSLLHEAASNGLNKTMKIVLDRIVESDLKRIVDERKKENQTPQDLARDKCHVECIKLLIQFNKDSQQLM